MTSNVGADIIRKRGSLGFKTLSEDISYEDMKKMLGEEVKKTFKPEFLNRIDELLVFRPLGKEHLYKIVELEISNVNARLIEQGFQVQLDQAAKDFFIEKGFDPLYGARPLKRVIQRYLEDPLAEDIIRGVFGNKFNKGKLATVMATLKGDSLYFV